MFSMPILTATISLQMTSSSKTRSNSWRRHSIRWSGICRLISFARRDDTGRYERVAVQRTIHSIYRASASVGVTWNQHGRRVSTCL